jgi:hypothetical protein
MKALATASAGISDRECLRPMGVSVDGSETVLEARGDTGSGPTRSICTCNKLANGRLKLSRGASMCRITLDCWQGVYAHVHVRQSFPTPGHTNCWDINLMLALATGWLRLWRVSKDLASERCGCEWPRLCGGCVTVKVDVCPGNVHLF